MFFFNFDKGFDLEYIFLYIWKGIDKGYKV